MKKGILVILCGLLISGCAQNSRFSTLKKEISVHGLITEIKTINESGKNEKYEIEISTREDYILFDCDIKSNGKLSTVYEWDYHYSIIIEWYGNNNKTNNDYTSRLRYSYGKRINGLFSTNSLIKRGNYVDEYISNSLPTYITYNGLSYEEGKECVEKLLEVFELIDSTLITEFGYGLK